MSRPLIINDPNYVWVDAIKKKYPEAEDEILLFISSTSTNVFSYDSDYNSYMENYWCAGMCYYYALILKDAFGGSICGVYNHGHIVYVSPKNIIYDGHGINDDIYRFELFPVTLFSKMYSDSFKHTGLWETLSVKERVKEYLNTYVNISEYYIRNPDVYHDSKFLEMNHKFIDYCRNYLTTGNNGNYLYCEFIDGIKNLDRKWYSIMCENERNIAGITNLF